jgi:hypothetical protein
MHKGSIVDIYESSIETPYPTIDPSYVLFIISSYLIFRLQVVSTSSHESMEVVNDHMAHANALISTLLNLRLSLPRKVGTLNRPCALYNVIDHTSPFKHSLLLILLLLNTSPPNHQPTLRRNSSTSSAGNNNEVQQLLPHNLARCYSIRTCAPL